MVCVMQPYPAFASCIFNLNVQSLRMKSSTRRCLIYVHKVTPTRGTFSQLSRHSPDSGVFAAKDRVSDCIPHSLSRQLNFVGSTRSLSSHMRIATIWPESSSDRRGI